MIYGEHVILGPIERHHLPIMLEYRNDPEMRQYFREYRVISLEHQTKWWESKVLEDPSWEYFVIHPKDNREHVIGMTGLTYIHPVCRSGELAIVIGDKNYRQKGLGADTVKTIARYGFLDLNLNRIDCEVYANNPAVKLYRKLGFVGEGVKRENYFCHGKFWDSYMLSMLRSDFDKLPWAKEKFTE